MKWALEGTTCLRALPEAGDTEAVVPLEVTRFAPGALSGCTAIVRLILPDAVRVLPVGFAQGCTSLESVRWPAGLTEIRAGAFAGCTSLQTIRLPETVTALGEGAFTGCHPLPDIVFPGAYTYRIRQSRAFPPFARMRAFCAPEASFASASAEEKLALACGYCLHPELEERYAPANAQAIRTYLEEELPNHLGELCEKQLVYDVLLACADRGLISSCETLRRFLTYARTQPINLEQKRRLDAIEAGAGLTEGERQDASSERDKRLLRRIRQLMTDAEMTSLLRREGVEELSPVRWRDEERPAPKEALQYILCAYISKWPALNDHVPPLQRLADADDIASLLSPADLQSACAALRCPEKPQADGKTAVCYPRRLLPCLRYGGAREACHALMCIGRWRRYDLYGQDGLKAAGAAEHAILLSDAREALLYAARSGCLAEYAVQRGLAPDAESVLMERFALSEDEVFRFDTGRDTFTALLQEDLSLLLRRERDGAMLADLPADADDERAQACSVAFHQLRARTEQLMLETRRSIARELAEARPRDLDGWRQTYLAHRACRAVAESVLWQQTLSDRSVRFLLEGSGATGADGMPCPLDPQAQYTVAHPSCIPEKELAWWQQRPFLSDQLLMPLMPVRPGQHETWQDRYDGLVVPLRLLNRLADVGFSTRRMSAGQVQLLFFGRYALSMTAHIPDAEELAPGTLVTLGSLRNASVAPRALLRLMALMDRALLTELIAAGRMEAAPYLELLAPEQIEPLMNRCIEEGRTASVAALLAWRTSHAPKASDPLELRW